MLEFDDIQHILLTRAPALTGRRLPVQAVGAVGGYAALSNYTALGGTLTVFSLPQ